MLAHNKTLAAQLYAEFKEFFPNNAVEYFVSYYDYYQPEAYVPKHDLYIEKETEINEDIDRLRLSATAALLSRRDVLIVASVSCIYGIGNPTTWGRSRSAQSWHHPPARSSSGTGRHHHGRNDMGAPEDVRVRGDVGGCAGLQQTAYRVAMFGDGSSASSSSIR